MAAAPEPTSIIIIILASLFASAPFGIPMATLALGTGFCVLGVMGRAAFDLQRASEGDGQVKFARIMGWMGAGLLGAPMGALLITVGLKALYPIAGWC